MGPGKVAGSVAVVPRNLNSPPRPALSPWVNVDLCQLTLRRPHLAMKCTDDFGLWSSSWFLGGHRGDRENLACCSEFFRERRDRNVSNRQTKNGADFLVVLIYSKRCCNATYKFFAGGVAYVEHVNL